MKTILSRFLMMALVVAATGTAARAAKKPTPADINAPILTTTDTWDIGVIQSLEARKGTLTILIKGSGQTVHRQAGKIVENIDESSFAAKPGNDVIKTYQLSRDCQFARLTQPRVSFSDFRPGELVRVTYLNQDPTLVATKVAIELNPTGRKRPGTR